MARITKRIIVHAPLATVQQVTSGGPERWCEWYAGLSAPTRVSGHGGVGTVSDHGLLIAGHQYPLTHTVVEATGDDLSFSTKGTFEGAITGWHRVTFAAVNGDTEVTIEDEAALTGKPPGATTDERLVERMYERSIEHTLDNLKVLCEDPIPSA